MNHCKAVESSELVKIGSASISQYFSVINDRIRECVALGIISKLNDAKKDEIISSGREGVGIDIISISSFIIFLASQ